METMERRFDEEMFRRRLTERRKELGLTKTEVAKRAGISRQRYSDYELKPKQEMRMKTCAAIAIALETTVDTLMG